MNYFVFVYFHDSLSLCFVFFKLGFFSPVISSNTFQCHSLLSSDDISVRHFVIVLN
jgi:hypothetical protein